ncbi:MAG: hypothetical protein JNM02_06445 [Anaerolineales bacterium]|nr:hypothetical protein [Anaerolineales bacterium]
MNAIQITGLLAILGSILYALGDTLLLASKVDINLYPKLAPFKKLLSDAEKFVSIPSEKMMQGALTGVFATPLMIAGFWHVYQGLFGANETLRMTTALLFGTASIIGTFVHGSFFYAGEYVKALNTVNEDSQHVIVELFTRHRKILIVTYAPLLAMIVTASILFSIGVITNQTLFPSWMAAITPVTMTIAWLFLKRILPAFITDPLEGAGFNIAYFIFFVCTTITLWNS